MGTGNLEQPVLGLTIDCADAPRIARFWALALGYRLAPPPEGWTTWEQFLTEHRVPVEEWVDSAVIEPISGDGPRISFLKVPEPKLVKNRVHLDLKVSGGRHIDQPLRESRIQTKAAELTAHGATPLREERVEGRLDHLVMADPEGNELTVTAPPTAARYGDALPVAAETTVDPDTVTALDQQADQVVEGLTACAAWPALRATLILNAVDGRNPLTELRTAAAEHELESARDAAAVLAWRIHAPQDIGPLPWIPPIPAKLTEHPGWGPYLSARAGLVQSCAAAVREAGHLGTPGWLMPGQQLAPDLIEDVELWRAGTGVDAADRRVLGPIQLGTTARTWQQSLEGKIQSALRRGG